MRQLLIGGPRDGERLEMPDDRPEVKLIATRDTAPTLWAEVIPEDYALATCIYRREEWRDGRSDRRYVVWVHAGVDDAMARLLKGYNPQTATRIEMQLCPVCKGTRVETQYTEDGHREAPCTHCRAMGYVERPR